MALPDAVVLPNSADEVVAVLRLCCKHGVPFTPRGAGTSLAGGTIPLQGGVLIGLTRMNRILAIDHADRVAEVEPGVVNIWLTNRLQGSGLQHRTACQPEVKGGRMQHRYPGLRCRSALS